MASIISYNAGAGISGLWESGTTSLSLDSLDIFGNQSELSLNPAFAASYWTWDPIFTDRNADDYSLGAAGALYAMEQAGTVIGYRSGQGNY